MAHKRFHQKKRYLIPMLIIAAIILFRLLLPTMVKSYVNNALSDMPGYYGEVEDIDISLWRGAYVIDSLYLNKIDAGSQVPFISIIKTDISVEWKSLLQGRIVSEVYLTQPSVIYVFEDHEGSEVETELDDWTEVLTDLVPISINKLGITKGKLAFVQVVPDPNIDLQIYNITATATNLQNVDDRSVKLPSTLTASGSSIGDGSLQVDGKLNLLKIIPDMDISMSLEDAQATSLNDAFNHYAGLDFEEGTYSVYSEIAIADGYLKSYFKPILKDSKLIGDEDGFFERVWEGVAGFFKFILKNQKTDNIATKIPVEGDLNNTSTNVWSTIFNLIKNAWIEAFKGEIDENIEFEDAEELAQPNK